MGIPLEEVQPSPSHSAQAPAICTPLGNQNPSIDLWAEEEETRPTM